MKYGNFNVDQMSCTHCRKKSAYKTSYSQDENKNFSTDVSNKYHITHPEKSNVQPSLLVGKVHPVR